MAARAGAPPPHCAFAQKCTAEGRDYLAYFDELRRPLRAPACLLDMTKAEQLEHFRRVDQRARESEEHRALILLWRKGYETHARRAFLRRQGELDGVPTEEVEQMLGWIIRKVDLNFDITGALLHFLLPGRVIHAGALVAGSQITELEWLVVAGRMLLLYDTFLYSKRAKLIFEHSYLISQGVQEDPDRFLADAGEESSEHSDALDIGTDTLKSQEEEEESENDDEREGQFLEYYVPKDSPLHSHSWGRDPEVDDALLKEMTAKEASILMDME
ncbi:unnamed protein product [Prorocentrum cordatum]|uniref:Uncharacterized protein n=1 Tax=Prorocentrum cordatum TaxID=2364126 RepID=A0ABN9SYL1_9DINO|nr:unnamed protein product [Polarella glacialis]|mmetsp:Transcript_2878/g.7709  ORF Transcript_2878/g.7709 Transcript_2878/m.7709 type:complete len:273 (-) Transcript_2878:103-921(-)